ncbi:MAG: hypothetical protein B6I20_12975 [Bacteroidetes bacterium 4572_117]|nr:MAG: hypothetical protein B6I20_12975 [Bacteroidetes bacterium 4572_117]
MILSDVFFFALTGRKCLEDMVIGFVFFSSASNKKAYRMFSQQLLLSLQKLASVVAQQHLWLLAKKETDLNSSLQ